MNILENFFTFTCIAIITNGCYNKKTAVMVNYSTVDRFICVHEIFGRGGGHIWTEVNRSSYVSYALSNNRDMKKLILR